MTGNGPSYLIGTRFSTILLKDFYLFKIFESVISFCLKKISNSTILNKSESFSKMVDYGPWTMSLVYYVNLIISPQMPPHIYGGL